MLLAVGLVGGFNYFRLKGPPAADLHEVKLRDVTNMRLETEFPGSKRIDNIWLKTSTGVTIRYRNRFPYSAEVQRLDPNFGLLLDTSNAVWAVTTTKGEVLAQRYFEEYNIEAKSVGKMCGLLLGVMGTWMLLGFIYTECRFRAGKLPVAEHFPVRVRELILLSSLLGYLALFGFVIAPWLRNVLPAWLIGLIWVLSGGVLGNSIVNHFRRRPPHQ